MRRGAESVTYRMSDREVHGSAKPRRLGHEQFMAVESHVGWDMSKGYLFATTSQRGKTAARGSTLSKLK